MRIEVAFDKFRGTLTAREAGDVVGEALRAELPAAQVVGRPQADGGEGTLAALHTALGGNLVARRVTGPLGEPVMASYLLDPAGRALVEVAAASGLSLLRADRRDPLRAATDGTGELVADAIRGGAREVWIAAGGSASVDGGSGLLRALGFRLLDSAGEDLPPGGAALIELARVVPPADFPSIRIVVLCDVDHPLLGEGGAAAVFGPQKGADPAAVALLERALRRFATVLAAQTGREVAALPRGGAAGGLAAGVAGFLGAALVSGAEQVAAHTGLATALAGAAWLVTGEGRLDATSLRGKVVGTAARLARAAGARVAVLAGGIEVSAAALREAGVDIALATGDGVPSSAAEASRRLDTTARRLAREHLA